MTPNDRPIPPAVAEELVEAVLLALDAERAVSGAVAARKPAAAIAAATLASKATTDRVWRLAFGDQAAGIPFSGHRVAGEISQAVLDALQAERVCWEAAHDQVEGRSGGGDYAQAASDSSDAIDAVWRLIWDATDVPESDPIRVAAVARAKADAAFVVHESTWTDRAFDPVGADFALYAYLSAVDAAENARMRAIHHWMNEATVTEVSLQLDDAVDAAVASVRRAITAQAEPCARCGGAGYVVGASGREVECHACSEFQGCDPDSTCPVCQPEVPR
jgi:hypothetical protein